MESSSRSIVRGMPGIMVYGLASLFMNCSSPDTSREIVLSNPSEVDRKSVTVDLAPADFSDLLSSSDSGQLVVEEIASGKLLVDQWIDIDGDEEMDQWIFQVDLQAGESKKYKVRLLQEGEEKPKAQHMTYSRFVPERTDDYTWENDRVAFRTYGPEAQRRIEASEYGGTLSSGMDAWLKRVEYPIINSWYAKNTAQEGAYHIDSGEGYDPYHVGSSRGIGGTGIWLEDSLYISKNFISYKKIAEGPIRTVFQLEYAPWQVGDTQVSETKLISLDLGSNLSHFVSEFTGLDQSLSPAIGISLHDKKGTVMTDPEAGIFRYWEAIDDSHLGLGIVMAPSSIASSKDHRVEYPDGSHILVIGEKNATKVEYYAGFGWDKSGQFNTTEDWDHYLKSFAQTLAKPLVVEVGK
ncbi:DUF4861 domain-containing protein [Echinicola pacifica]|nr:DUF4861 domain-containing protein [Echinicola pacifica]